MNKFIMVISALFYLIMTVSYSFNHWLAVFTKEVMIVDKFCFEPFILCLYIAYEK